MFILSRPAVWVTLYPQHFDFCYFEWCYRFPCFPQNLLLLGLGGIVTTPVTRRKVCECVCLTVSLPASMHWLLYQAYGPECRHHTSLCKKKNLNQFLLCFLKFINSAWPVLGTVVGVLFIKTEKTKKQKGFLLLKISVWKGHIYVAFSEIALEVLSSFSFLHSFSLSCHLKSTFIFLMRPLKSSFRFFCVSLESSDIVVTFYI